MMVSYCFFFYSLLHGKHLISQSHAQISLSLCSLSFFTIDHTGLSGFVCSTVTFLPSCISECCLTLGGQAFDIHWSGGIRTVPGEIRDSFYYCTTAPHFDYQRLAIWLFSRSPACPAISPNSPPPPPRQSMLSVEGLPWGNRKSD